MCAIAGLLGQTADETILEKMEKTLERRGPDGRGRYQDHRCTLLHSRLAIIDPAGGAQPMQLDWEGRTFVLTYNGELYNTEELRRELNSLGHSFLDHSDTEVVLHSYAQWREECVNRFNGIFAFAVWEKETGRLFLARDRIGVKPLFFTLQGGGLIFASEIKTILAIPDVKPELDAQGAAELIMFGPGRLPGSGVFRGIRELEPGQYAVFENGKLSVHRYWMLRDRVHEDSFSETVEKVRFLVLDAIKRQMVSDVPLGTFLSGGLDSSIISAVCAGEMHNRRETIQTFSVDYLNNSQYFQANRFQPNSDESYIRLMQNHIHSCHHWTVLTPDALTDCLEDATYARDLPGMADVDFSLLAFCRDIRKKVKVGLSGECADEIFGGYPWYRDPEVRSLEGFPWAQNTADRAAILNPGIVANSRELVMEAYSQTCRESDILPENSPQERRIKEMVNLNFRWFMQTLLDRKDRMSMYCGLEVRVPFCDYRIAEYLYGVPWEFKDWQGREKGLLRKAVEGILPDPVLYRKKSPYPKTFDPRYEDLVTQRLEKLLQDNNAPLFTLVSREAIRNYLSGSHKWPWYGQLMRRPQTIAYFLQLDYWLRRYDVALCF